MSSEHISSTPVNITHLRHQSSAFSEPNSRVPSPPLAKTMSENHSNDVTASSSTTSLIASHSNASSESPPPSITDAARSSSPTMSLNGSQFQNGEPLTQPNQIPDVDPQILEALRSKDRLYVLKLGEVMEGLINDRNRQRVELTPSTSYQRMLVHRCSAYYRLTPDSDQITKMIYVSLTSESRIPPKRIADLVPAEPTTQPAFKIMRRTQQERKTKAHSSTSSVTGEEADLSDVEPSEAGSMGGRSSATGGSSKKRMTIEEREAAYKEARSRIFNDYDERGSRDLSASSSSLSLSTSNSGGSVGDVDDSSSSLATESERSGPSFTRRSANVSNPTSSRPNRGGFTSNGSGSSRNSRAASPSFTYASLYEPAVSPGPPYDPSASGYPPASYMYHYQQPPNAHYPHYPYYPYPYSHIPPPSQNTPEGSTPSEMYPSHPPPPVVYGPPYIWPPPPNQAPMHTVSPVQHQNASNGQIPGSQAPSQPHPQSAQSQQHYYMPPPHGYYPMPGYYTPPGQPMHHPPPPGAPQFFDDTRIMNSSVPGNGNNNLYVGGEDLSQRGGGHGAGFNHRGRGGGHISAKTRGVSGPARSAWSYGPGIGIGGIPVASGNSSSASSVNGEAVGPRFNSSMRRTSNTSAGSSGQYRSSSNGDEAASQTSSTSSSSRHTFKSTTSSQHPLPARPDWAVGLKPDPNLSHNGSRNLSPISPPRSLNGGSNSPRIRGPQDQIALPILQANDFPPLTSMSEKRTSVPAAGGAWTNPASRSLLMTPPTGQGNVIVHHAAQAPALQMGQGPNVHHNHAIPRPEENEGFERPPPKATGLYDPNAGGKRGRPNNSMQIGQGMERGSFPLETDIAEQLGSMSMSSDPRHQRSSSYPPAGLS
ncbi:hypothetical protein L218DRAFT_891249 [Marasmius fiardii PR-910]|nr:hypothetical protein L218DRAFT_891249 [Marasmius fiardii PR-910]